jgi:hypothetical protein
MNFDKIIELLVYPGCTLPVTMITFLLILTGKLTFYKLFFEQIFYPTIKTGISTPVDD